MNYFSLSTLFARRMAFIIFAQVCLAAEEPVVTRFLKAMPVFWQCSWEPERHDPRFVHKMKTIFGKY